jgi:flagellar protein FlaG
MNIDGIGRPDPVSGTTRPTRPTGPDASRAAEPAVKVDTFPSSPPPDALEMVDAAFERMEELRSQNRELHFAKDPASGRVQVQVRDLDGNVIRTIPPSQALEIMGGAAL